MALPMRPPAVITPPLPARMQACGQHRRAMAALPAQRSTAACQAHGACHQRAACGRRFASFLSGASIRRLSAAFSSQRLAATTLHCPPQARRHRLRQRRKCSAARRWYLSPASCMWGCRPASFVPQCSDASYCNTIRRPQPLRLQARRPPQRFCYSSAAWPLPRRWSLSSASCV